MSEFKYLIDADLRAILDAIPIGTEIPCDLSQGFTAAYHPEVIRKTGKTNYIDVKTGLPYSMKYVEGDIANKRISLGGLISIAEKSDSFKLEIGEDERLYAYDTTIEELVKGKKKLGTESLIMFMATMPKKLVDAGLADTPAKMCNFVFEKVCAKVSNSKINAHGYKPTQLISIKNAIDDPVAIVRSKAADGSLRIGVLTKVQNADHELSLVIMQQDAERGDNFVTSIYGKHNIARYLRARQLDGDLIYLNHTGYLAQVTGNRDEAVLRELIEDYKKEHPEEMLDESRSEVNHHRYRRHGGRT